MEPEIPATIQTPRSQERPSPNTRWRVVTTARIIGIARMNPREYEIMFARKDAYWWYRGMLRVSRSTYANFFLAPVIWAVRVLTRAVSRARPAEEVASDFVLSPKLFEEILFSVLSLEARIVARGRLPFGVTVFVLAEKPVQGTSVSAK